MDVFLKCSIVNDLILEGDEAKARDKLIRILDFHKKNNLPYDLLVNHLIRQLGLYPYIELETADWQDRFVFESFKADIGGDKPVTLHREQSSVLRKLLEGSSLAISAPTSFGKSFIIDAFIALNKPKNVVIIVPTIALTDETRRRLQKKFADRYKIITTAGVELSDKNIFIFPQERAVYYTEKLEEIDILIVDEFYKASELYDKERSSSLINAIIRLGAKSKQKYFLAPNISGINDNAFTNDMRFVRLDFNTVFLDKYNYFEEIKGNEKLKEKYVVEILGSSQGRTLIYSGTYTEINKVSMLIIENFDLESSELLQDFQCWLVNNYSRSWRLADLVIRGCGIHNGSLHRSLSQIQVHLFEVEGGLKNIISTSSIVEGVNTSAENVILWKNKNGVSNLDDFTYRNIVGRAGRMFKYFIGNVYILERPPEPVSNELSLSIPDSILGGLDENDGSIGLTNDQISKIISYKEQMASILGYDVFRLIQNEKIFSTSDSDLILRIAQDLVHNSSEWNGLLYLNSDKVEDWDWLLYKIIKIQPGAWGTYYTAFVNFVKVLSRNWTESIPDLLESLAGYDIGIDEFFKLERNVTFKLATLLSDINILQMHILENPVDITPFVLKVSNAFLPPLVFQLEEYGLPRMISRKIHQEKVICFDFDDMDLHKTLLEFKVITCDGLIDTVGTFDRFDKYIIKHFYDGI